jgi:hypothetical protein
MLDRSVWLTRASGARDVIVLILQPSARPWCL